jgi:aerobic carbon-monoxide dehydrogenase small subunit
MSTQLVEMSIQQEVSVSTRVNGEPVETSVPAHLLLADFLRDTLGLTGTKVGCETGQCGACTVLLDGVSVKSCTILAAQLDGSEVVTIEGLSPVGSMTDLQNALWEQHAVQCGYCTPGMVLSLTDLLRRNPAPDEAEIRRWMDGTLCRCGVYQNAVRAVRSLVKSASTAA